MGEFNQCIDDVEIMDLPGHGCSFTWSRGTILKKLDRVMCNNVWAGKYPLTYQCYDTSGLFDHTPMEVQSRVRERELELDKVQKELLSGKGDMQLCNEEKKLREELGDQCTQFFHQKMREHHMRNRMVALRSLTGDTSVTQDDMKEEVIKFYKGLFKEVNDSHEVYLDEVKGYIQNQVPELKKRYLITGITEGEIKNTIFGMGLNRAPGEVFPAFNTTTLSLIPKTKCPVNIKEYRPIACYNVIYKCVTKILAERLKRVLDDIISYNQSAFVKGRMLSDSVLLMNELVNNYHKKEGRRRCALKIDILKAYDTVNGSLHGQFESSRGLRQGDPVSPYLFLIVMEGLTGILRKEDEEGNIDFYLGCEELKILNIMFADDMFVMFTANVKCITTIKGMLNRFGKIVGLSPNLEKIYFYVVGTPDEVVSRLKDIIGIPVAVLPMKLPKSFWLDRDWLRENVQFKVGNGESIYVWLDLWYEGGSLEQLPERITRLLPKNRSLTMADMINESNGWGWPVGCRFKAEVNSFRRRFAELAKRAEVEDIVEWKNGAKMDIRTKDVYEAIKRNGESKLWNKLIWHKYCIPRQCVVVWFLLRGRLETNDHVVRWKAGIDETCFFCAEKEDQ
ncbi:hypothetical protein LIER_26483 [Lithospermum erythrorhizon]|uniref:Reverse transcriptase domain-containing protein n=1 Tax=Lithospermum erythrorhizon TaxID=34254 RepID=A0AAV3RCG5_LITER